MRLLCLCDTPESNTGFADVSHNLFSRLAPHFESIDCWGINYHGWPNTPKYINRIFPAAHNGKPWQHPECIQKFLNVAASKNLGYTHLWMMQDTFNLCRFKLPEQIHRLSAEFGIRTFLYYPVDAALEPDWTDIVRAVDCPVAYTQYGKTETLKAISNQLVDANKMGWIEARSDTEIQVIPHGVDQSIFHPLPDREKLRKEYVIGTTKDGQPIPLSAFLKDGEVLMVNVNTNQRRKDPVRSLVILKRLLNMGMPVKLIMHMSVNGDTVSLEEASRQLDLIMGVHWMPGKGFKGVKTKVGEAEQPQLTKEELNVLYNCADIYLTTTLGEGWGLGVTEALAAGCLVAMPQHTSLTEIYETLRGMGEGDRILPINIHDDPIALIDDNTRLRYQTRADDAAWAIYGAWSNGLIAGNKRQPLGEQATKWLSWDSIALKWLKLFRETKSVKERI